jgi:hypothetical protein
MDKWAVKVWLTLAKDSLTAEVQICMKVDTLSSVFPTFQTSIKLEQTDSKTKNKHAKANLSNSCDFTELQWKIY